MDHIYIAFVDTPGIFASIIRRVLKQRYVHVVLSLDAGLTEAYSIGRRNPEIPLLAGFEKEDKVRILHQFPSAYYKICEIACDAETRQRIRERLEADYQRRFRIHYAVCGLPFLLIGHPFYIRNQYTCSSYLARILAEQGILISKKHFSLVTPRDFAEYDGMHTVFEGRLEEITEKRLETGVVNYES